jgi:hypothetical protein
MSSEATIRDRMIRDHQAWLGYLQPDGLVVSPAALVDAQIVLDTRAIDTQAKLAPFVTTIEDDENDRERKIISDVPGFLSGFLEWPDDLLFGNDPARPIPESLIVPLAELGETLEPTLALKDHRAKEPKPGEQPQPWLLLVKILDTGADLDAVTTGDQASWSASPTRRFERLLRETRVPIGLLINGTHIRLVYAPRGENSGSLTFPVAAMTEVAGRPILAALHQLLGQDCLIAGASDARLPALLQRSRDYQSSVSTALAQQVIDAAFDLLRGFQAANERTRPAGSDQGELLRDILAKQPNKVYEGLLTVLMRCVFLLYTEDRGLMPGGSLYQQNYALHGLFERLRADHARYPDTMDIRYGAWAQLLAIFRAIFAGCDHSSMKLPARAGYLFDPERFPFLEGRPTASSTSGRVPLVPDGTIFRVFERLLILNGERLSYRTLDVEQIGSVYEVMMGFGVGIAAGPSIAIKPKKKNGAPVPINLDELLRQPAGERAKWLKAATDQELSDKPGVALKAAKSIDDLLAALDQGKKIARSATPSPVPKGAMLLVPSDERRRSGSNYTPRSLTEPIVRKTLEPILERLGDDATPEQILDLKVCDPAMGSGAFLVEACRQLAEVLVKAWHRHKQLPTIPPDEDELLYAKRIIAQRCLYGVDKNPMAADLAKLSMWLATLARDHPFTFLDHSFRAGDSLVGLTKAQIASFTWEPGGGVQKQIWAQFIEPRLDEALAARREILVAGDFMNPATKRQRLDVADERLGLVRFIGDLAVAAFFAGEKEKQRKEKRQEYLEQLSAYLGDRSTLGPGVVAGDFMKRPQAPVDALKAREKGVTPFHWEIEFPEVFGRTSAGFDAVLGNPPFLGASRISEYSAGPEYAHWLKLVVAECKGQVDLCAFFFRRSFDSLSQNAAMGLLATNQIAFGDNRLCGLGPIIERGGTIYSAMTDFEWPGEATVRVSAIHIYGVAGLPAGVPLNLDGAKCDVINSRLKAEAERGPPSVLAANEGLAHNGTEIGGSGFVLDADEAARLLSDSANSEIVLPLTGGDEVNAAPSGQTTRFIITFRKRTLEEAERWPDLLEIVRARVLPHRLRGMDHGPGNHGKKYWWQHTLRADPLYEAIAGLRRCVVCARVSTYHAFRFEGANRLFNQKVFVFAFDSFHGFSVLQSDVHELWSLAHSSRHGEATNYTINKTFSTFPFPDHFEADPRLEAAGKAYYEFRAALMVRNDEGLTKTYNRFHDPEETSPDILQLRELHAAMDRAVLDAYGWTDIPTDCKFLLDYEEDDDVESNAAATSTSSKGRKKRKPYRYRWPDAVRDEVLARLLALNAKRAEEERLAGKTATSDVKSINAKRAGKKGRTVTGQLHLGDTD